MISSGMECFGIRLSAKCRNELETAMYMLELDEMKKAEG